MSEVTTQVDETLNEEVILEASSDSGSEFTKQLSQVEILKMQRQAVKQRQQQIKANKQMIEEMALEVSYWKAQADLLRYRFEKMDFYLKNLELEPKYLAAVEAQKLAEDKAADKVAGITPSTSPIISL